MFLILVVHLFYSRLSNQLDKSHQLLKAFSSQSASKLNTLFKVNFAFVLFSQLMGGNSWLTLVEALKYYCFCAGKDSPTTRNKL